MTDQRVVPGPDGSRFASVVHVTETGSTNADLLVEAGNGAPEGLVRVTDHQTAGRGRQARAWHDDPGNAMLMSVLLRPDRSFASLVPLLAGLAVTDAVVTLPAMETAGERQDQPLDPGSDQAALPVLALKWPNDVLVPSLGERKLAGILAEATTKGSPQGELAVVVGMGLNLRWHTPPPDDVAVRAATLREVAGVDVDRWDVVRAVLAAIDRWLGVAESEGPGPILDAYRQRCCSLDRQVRLQLPNEVIEGVVVAIADSGGLVVETSSGAVTVTAGEAHHV